MGKQKLDIAICPLEPTLQGRIQGGGGVPGGPGGPGGGGGGPGDPPPPTPSLLLGLMPGWVAYDVIDRVIKSYIIMNTIISLKKYKSVHPKYINLNIYSVINTIKTPVKCILSSAVTSQSGVVCYSSRLEQTE